MLLVPSPAAAASVVIIGAGVSGLACARSCCEAGLKVSILESSDDVGGRVRSDVQEGFILDRGFAVFLTAYPEAQRQLDYEALSLHSFWPGAYIQLENQERCMLVNPLVAPSTLFQTLSAPIGSAIDRFRLGCFVAASLLLRTDDQVLAREDEMDTDSFLRGKLQLSDTFVSTFFAPFLQGVFVATLQQQSSRMLEFVLRMFVRGSAALPAAGIGAVAQQMAAALPTGTVSLRTHVSSLDTDARAVILTDGTRIEYDALVVATDGPEAARLLGTTAPVGRCSTCLYFGFDGPPPVTDPLLVLNGVNAAVDGTTVNNVCFPSAVAPSYAPAGRSLASVTLLGQPRVGDDDEDAELVTGVRKQLEDWFGPAVRDWRFLRRYTIWHAQPSQAPPNVKGFDRAVRHADRIYCCGDHRSTPSLNGAMRSGRLAAEALMGDI